MLNLQMRIKNNGKHATIFPQSCVKEVRSQNKVSAKYVDPTSVDEFSEEVIKT